MSEEEMTTDVNAFADIEGLFENKKGPGGTFLSIFEYQICQRSRELPANTEGWTGPHETTNPKTKEKVFSYSKPYDRMVARIADIQKATKEFDASKGGGKVTNWNIILLSAGKRLTLQLTWIDHTLKRFLKVAPNIDFTRPILISAFKSMKNGDAKQAVSFRQYQGDISNIEAFKNVDGWTKVEEYWQPQRDADGKAIEGSQYKGADGSILPVPEYDEEDKSWDYRAQNKFLAIYFRDNILPTIKALAEKYGLNNPDTDTTVGETATHTGPTVNDTPVTTRPFDVTAKSVSDMITGEHTFKIKQLCKALNFNAESVCNKLVSAELSELNDETGRYVIYKLEEKLAKTAPAVVATPAPAPVAETPALTPAVSAKPIQQQIEEADIPWDADSPPVEQSGASAMREMLHPTTPASVPSNDDIDWE